MDNLKTDQETSLPGLLEDRPAIHKSIKYLHLQWDAEYEGDLGNGFGEWCKSMPNKLELEVLELEIKVTQIELDELCSEEGISRAQCPPSLSTVRTVSKRNFES